MGLSDAVSGWLVTYPALPWVGTLIRPSSTLGECITIRQILDVVYADTQIRKITNLGVHTFAEHKKEWKMNAFSKLLVKIDF